MFKSLSVIAAFFLFSFNAQAFLSSPVVSKICGYQDLSQQEKDEFLKHAFHNFLPAATKKSLARGLSNFNVTAINSEAQKNKHCKEADSNEERRNLCQKVSKVATTSYRYDVGMTLDEIKSKLEFYKPAIKEVFKHCEDTEENLDRIVEDFDPSQEVLASLEDGDFASVQTKVQKVANLLNIELADKRVSNPLPKTDPFSKRKVFDSGRTASCEKTLMGALGLMDQIHLKTLEFLGKVAQKFAPAAPEIKTK